MTLALAPTSPRSALGSASSPALAGLSTQSLPPRPSAPPPAAPRPASGRAGAPVPPPLTWRTRTRLLLACGT